MSINASDDFAIASETHNSSMEVNGLTPPDTYTLLNIHALNGSVRINGQPTTHYGQIILPPNHDFHAITVGGCELDQFYLPVDTYHKILEKEELSENSLRNINKMYATSEAGFSAISNTITNISGSNGLDTANNDMALNALDSKILSLLNTNKISERTALSRQQYKINKTYARATTYIQNNIKDPIRIPELCRAIGTSQRTLERTFRAVYNCSPRQYIEYYRLSLIRCSLLKNHPHTTSIEALAREVGINHMGRFSGRYFEFFNEYPHETFLKAL
ncbi:hypothetical protein BST96_00350 [Oceanicoccus sagamiensis]|uniref:HTH araC/xylS-type domain-containing protein n=2 Tax=Oceanicoccus sagamiensis TaxID=716816 RepID=A0A1X9N3B6_9GAMM|nr:hypothetical protein BST96_00350 [Oceanicoccus sagamiensis]